MERVFRAHMEEFGARAALGDAAELAGQRRCCLLCFERDHRGCHRRLVAELIRAETGQAVVDLVPEAGMDAC